MIAQPVAGHSSVDGIWRYPVKSMGGEELLLGKVTPLSSARPKPYRDVDRSSGPARRMSRRFLLPGLHLPEPSSTMLVFT